MKRFFKGYRICLTIIALLLTVLFASCGNSAFSAYHVVLLGSADGSVFKESIDNISFSSNKYHDAKADQTKRVSLINGRVEEVCYEQSIKDELRDYTVYSSENANLSCYYDASSDNLIQIYATNNEIVIPKEAELESSYRDWVESLLTFYGVEDLSVYAYSCQTSVVVSNENATYQETYAYFYSNEKANEKISCRVFTYTKYVADYPTTDRIEVSIFEETGSVIVKFDEHKFDEPVELSFDESAINTAVESFVTSSVNSEKYKFKSMSIKNQVLTHYDNEVCIKVTAEVELITKTERTPICMLVTLLVFTE